MNVFLIELPAFLILSPTAGTKSDTFDATLFTTLRNISPPNGYLGSMLPICPPLFIVIIPINPKPPPIRPSNGTDPIIPLGSAGKDNPPVFTGSSRLTLRFFDIEVKSNDFPYSPSAAGIKLTLGTN